MSLYSVRNHMEQEPKSYIGASWKKLKAALLRILNREREMVRLRVAMGMMSEARQSDAVEYRETFDRCRELAERVRQLEHERDEWRSSKAAIQVETAKAIAEFFPSAPADGTAK